MALKELAFRRINLAKIEEATNALQALASLPIEDLAGNIDDDSIIYMVGGYTLRVGHVRDAREALSAISNGEFNGEVK